MREGEKRMNSHKSHSATFDIFPTRKRNSFLSLRFSPVPLPSHSLSLFLSLSFGGTNLRGNSLSLLSCSFSFPQEEYLPFAVNQSSRQTSRFSLFVLMLFLLFGMFSFGAYAYSRSLRRHAESAAPHASGMRLDCGSTDY